MKLKITYILFTFVCLVSQAQQTESFTQYVFNNFAINPAVAGTRECLDIQMGSRLQWVGIEGAPRTTFLTVHKALFDRKSMKPKSWHGIGGYIVDDRTGLYARTSFSFAYAYHLTLSKDYSASAGLYFGGRNQRFGGVSSSIDPLLTNSSSFIVIPDVTIGGLVYSKTLFVGISAKQLFKRKNQSSASKGIGENSKNRIQYYMTGGARIKSKQFVYSYVPSFLIKYNSNVPVSFEASMIVYGEDNRIGLGTNIRLMESISGIVEFRVSKEIAVGYSYDYPISNLSLGTSGSHEFVLKIVPCGKGQKDFGGTVCPVF